jgi:hypothetical protein
MFGRPNSSRASFPCAVAAGKVVVNGSTGRGQALGQTYGQIGEIMTDSTTATDTVTSTPPAPTDRGQTIGTVAPESRPVGVDDRAVIAVFDDLEAVQRAILKLADEGFPIERISIIGKDMQSELRVNGFITMGDIAGPSAATGAWVGGLFGLLSGTALLFVPGAGPLIVLGPLATGALGAAQGALLGGAVGAVLGHFVAKEKLPKYERLVATGSYLVVVHGKEDEVERARRILLDNGSTDAERHDDFRGSIDQVGPIEKVFEGMRVVDANGKEIGKVDFVKMGDPDAVTTRGQDEGARPNVPPPFADRLLRIGYIKVDRKGLFARDVYAAASEIDRVEDDPVKGDKVILNVPEEMLLQEASDG